MITIAPLTEENATLIVRVYKVYPDDKPLKYWEEQILQGGAFVFNQYSKENQLVYSGIIQICEDGLHAIVGGGVEHKENKSKIDVPEMYTFIKKAANFLQKSHIRLTGRVGWWKYLRGLGFKKTGQRTCTNGRLALTYEKRI